MELFEELQNQDVRLASSTRFTDDYKNAVFTIWYNEGKPVVRILHDKIPKPDTNYGDKPSEQALRSWVNSDIWQKRAFELDSGVRESVDLALVQTKVEMLSRHAKLGQRMQEMAMDYLEKHVGDLSAPAAVRMLVDGVRIEEEALGIGGALKKMMSMSNEELLDNLKQILEDSPIDEEFINE